MPHFTEKTHPEEQLLDGIADALAQQGFFQLQDFLPTLLAEPVSYTYLTLPTKRLV